MQSADKIQRQQAALEVAEHTSMLHASPYGASYSVLMAKDISDAHKHLRFQGGEPHICPETIEASEDWISPPTAGAVAVADGVGSVRNPDLAAKISTLLFSEMFGAEFRAELMLAQDRKAFVEEKAQEFIREALQQIAAITSPEDHRKEKGPSAAFSGAISWIGHDGSLHVTSINVGDTDTFVETPSGDFFRIGHPHTIGGLFDYAQEVHIENNQKILALSPESDPQIIFDTACDIFASWERLRLLARGAQGEPDSTTMDPKIDDFEDELREHAETAFHNPSPKNNERILATLRTHYDTISTIHKCIRGEDVRTAEEQHYAAFVENDIKAFKKGKELHFLKPSNEAYTKNHLADDGFYENFLADMNTLLAAIPHRETAEQYSELLSKVQTVSSSIDDRFALFTEMYEAIITLERLTVSSNVFYKNFFSGTQKKFANAPLATSLNSHTTLEDLIEEDLYSPCIITIQVEHGSNVYTISDGITDQYGQPFNVDKAFENTSMSEMAAVISQYHSLEEKVHALFSGALSRIQGHVLVDSSGKAKNQSKLDKDPLTAGLNYDEVLYVKGWDDLSANVMSVAPTPNEIAAFTTIVAEPLTHARTEINRAIVSSTQTPSEAANTVQADTGMKRRKKKKKVKVAPATVKKSESTPEGPMRKTKKKRKHRGSVPLQ